jgi:hypothetical protein
MVRKNLVGTIVFTALLSLSLSACQSEKTDKEDDASASMDMNSLVIPSVNYFQMQDSTQVYGKMSQSVENVNEDGRDLVRVTFDIWGGVDGKSILFFDEQSGAPVRIIAEQTFQDMEMVNSSYYLGDQVMRIVSVPVQDTQDTVYTSIPENTRDWMQSTFIIQALDLESLVGDTLKIPFYQGFGQAFVETATVVVVGAQQISVPAGDFEAYRVHIDFAGSMAEVYIEKDGEKRLLRHDVPGRFGPLSTVMILDEDAEIDG